MIRFHISEGDSTTITEWQEEPVKHGIGAQTAVMEVTRLRQLYPNAAIRIERTTLIPAPERNQVRFVIRLPNNETRYTKVVAESEADTLLAELREKFPKGEISRG